MSQLPKAVRDWHRPALFQELMRVESAQAALPGEEDRATGEEERGYKRALRGMGCLGP